MYTYLMKDRCREGREREVVVMNYIISNSHRMILPEREPSLANILVIVTGTSPSIHSVEYPAF